MKGFFRLLFLIGGLALVQPAGAQPNSGYQMPPQAIADLVDAPQTPILSLHAPAEWLLLLQRPGYPSIEELAQPELRLAGLRINPRTSGPSRPNSFSGLFLKEIKTGKTYPVLRGIVNPQVENLRWSADGSRFAFSMLNGSTLELWFGEISTQQAQRLSTEGLNAVLGSAPLEWFPDNLHLLARMRPAGRGEAPAAPLVPSTPVVEETSGEKAAVPTYQDLLSNPHDEQLFEYYTQSQLVVVDVRTGEKKPFGKPGMIASTQISPDGNYVLVETLQRPFSYHVPYFRFPTVYEIYDRQGNLVRRVAEAPLTEVLPKGSNAVREGPRSFRWRADAPATLCWVEAQDGGDPNRKAEVRDKLFLLPAPFAGAPQESISFKLRFGGIIWGNDGLAIASESWRSTRKQIISRFEPGKADSKKQLFELSTEDRYNDPGDFATTANAGGYPVLLMGNKGRSLYLTGEGASAEGDRPFIKEFDLATGTVKELWRSQAPYYESPIRIVNPEEGLFISRRESREEPPNYFQRSWKKKEVKALTQFTNPYAALEGVEKQLVQYERKDGVKLQGNLYLPKGYDAKKDGPLPVIMWAYPTEFKSAEAAGQIAGSPYEFIRLNWGSPLYWVTQGYAVFDDPSMPIIGEGEQEPNDTYREQLVANAEAAVNKLVDMGVGDRNRMAIGGHSYGAFMTANLLAHSNLFAAGIARSGAYNRTLTPFGFQAEERHYWDAKEVYQTMSPFMHADQINEPILLIHGEADNNSGTFPIQSERLYSAIKGLGGTARLVLLPHESHGYRARESILHTLWEQNQWLDKYVKNRNKSTQP